MNKVVGLKFAKTNYIYYFKIDDKMNFKKGDYCLVKTSIGLDMGKVVIPYKLINSNELDVPLKDIYRKANKRDMEKWEKIKLEERNAVNIFKEKNKKFNLSMKIVYVKYLFDKSRIIFYFTSEQRVDFREMVKDLAKIFKTKIELRQIGVRDGTKMIGGIGMCGREICCASFMQRFTPIHINMAKIQRIALNQSKVSGLCGRLMCCLSYESEFYKESLKKYPKLGSKIKVKSGMGKVTEVNILRKYIIVETREDKDITKKIKISEEEYAKLILENKN
ncbi:MAG: regulatory iron-sulfur-containing complex subunit RicT, partial [Candidatus Caldatribacteriota bacterium]|nr:regulatory iron-sulfur-containing complex subunit RicT [Candidatus Caldatribacteriota bacterium]